MNPSTAHPPEHPPDLPLSVWRRSAWVEIDCAQLRRNFEIIHAQKPPALRLLAVVKDNAYGHGAAEVARAALASGAWGLGVTTLDEAVELRTLGIEAPILLLGERTPDELPACLAHRLRLSVGEMRVLRRLARLARHTDREVPVHLKIDTGMSRYGVRWDEAADAVKTAAAIRGIRLEGLMSHFAMSDEADKSFALEQLARFEQVLGKLADSGGPPLVRHFCNTGGFLDLPQAWFDMVRLGILPLGVYPSKTCRRLPGLKPVMSVKARIVSVRDLQPGDHYGYGLRYRATSPRRIAVVPVGYGDGFPRLRNEGCVLVHRRRAPLIGSVAMDAMAVDVTDIPEAQLFDDVVLMGQDGAEEITANEIAAWKHSVCYDVLSGWRSRLPRVCVQKQVPP
ncbi:MAG: alanine racemase [Verrucomicrobia bacterium]|nr:alanine racemase [Verrucomicrobiota bacterium]